MDATVSIHNPLTALSGVTGGKVVSRPPGKLHEETGHPLVDILIISVFFRLLFFAFFGVFSFF